GAKGGKYAFNDGVDPLVKQENLFEAAVQDVNAVFKVGLEVRGRMALTWGSGSSAGIEFGVSLIGEEPVEGDQNEVGEDFLFHSALGLGVKILNADDALADLVEFFNAPPAMVDVHEFLEWIALGVEQRRAQAKDGAGDGVFEQS